MAQDSKPFSPNFPGGPAEPLLHSSAPSAPPHHSNPGNEVGFGPGYAPGYAPAYPHPSPQPPYPQPAPSPSPPYPQANIAHNPPYPHPVPSPNPPYPNPPYPQVTHVQPASQPGYQPGFQPGFQPGYQPGYMPVVQQPGAQPVMPGGWMSMPPGRVGASGGNCPPGLEYLATVDHLLVRQKVELLEAFTGFETNNKYTIKNSLGQKVYYAVEENDCCTRMCCGPARPFEMKILDNFNNEVIHLSRPLACGSCLCPCCLQSVEVSAPPGRVLGTVHERWSICRPNFDVCNAQGDTILTIRGPFCTFSICGDVKFEVLSGAGERRIGSITKQWGGLARELFTDADYFGVSFPVDLDVTAKALLLGACFLIDFMFFEKAGNREDDGPGML